MRINIAEDLGVPLGKQIREMVELIHQAALLRRRKEVELLLGGLLEEDSLQTAVAILGGLEVLDHVATGAPDGAADLDEQRLGVLRAPDLNDRAGLDPVAAAQRVVDEEIGVALDDLERWLIAHVAAA